MEIEKEYVLDVYNQIAKSFDNTRGKNFWNVVNNFIQNIPDQKLNILDLGCGNGKYIPLFKTNNKVIALDNSIELLKIVNQKYPNIKIINSDVTNTGLESNIFDHIISIAVIHHLNTIERRVQMIKEIYRIIKIGGTGLITAWAISAITNKFIKLNEYNDYLIPWNNEFNRFYHLFTLHEFEELIKEADLDDKLCIILKIFEYNNYAIIIKKLK